MRRLWPRQPPLPAFLGLGAQKAGTTTLHCLLEQHPQLYLPPAKELQYFSLHFHRGERWYRQQFAEAPAAARCGDITPYYLFHPWAAERIAALLPRAKLIVLVRDPVERTLSHYFHARRLGFEQLPLQQALAMETGRLADAEQQLRTPSGRHLAHQECSYVSRSRYELQLHRYLNFFPAQQLLVLASEELFTSPLTAWNKLLQFLDLEPVACPPLPTANLGQGEALQVEAELRKQLMHQLAPTYEAMVQQWGIHWPLRY